MTKNNFYAVIFDLDGVITKTALVHSSAWKKMFDDFLKERAEKTGEEFLEFTHERDYLNYVDGKPRNKGVQSFLESRGIELPFGDPEDGTEKETICGIGNRKNIAFNEILKHDGVEVYPSTVELIHELKNMGIKVGVASSSKNCKVVLESAGLLDLMETRVDGLVSAELGLHGKPEPDIFTTAADNLGVTYDRAVIVEDAVSGVQAGAKGNFGLVLGIAREKNEKELKKNGADIVVTDIDKIGLKGIKEWFQSGLEKNNWEINYFDYNPKKEKSRESLLTIGNGYFGTRGALEECKASKNNYPGTYIAGVFNRLKSSLGDTEIENEDFVNCQNWLPITFSINNKDWVNINKVKILDIKRSLDLSCGLLKKTLIIKNTDGKIIRIISRRFASMDDPHLAAIEYSIQPINYSGLITIKTEIDGAIINSGVERYKQLNQKHLKVIDSGEEKNKQYLFVKTTQSNIKIATASKILISKNNKQIDAVFTSEFRKSQAITKFLTFLQKDDTLKIEKIVSIYTSKDKNILNPLNSARQKVRNIFTFKELLKRSKTKWEKIWEKIDIKIEGDRIAQKLLRIHAYHLMITASDHNINIDAGIPARGLHGEAYRGHIFWDELFILPFYDIHFKDTAKSVLQYRFRRLDEARKYAKEYGFEGAMFPWQSGSSGREETQILHLNPLTGKWGNDYSSLQRHVSLAIAFNIWQYFNITGDKKFIEEQGLEMFLEICRFWASKCDFNEKTGKYSISKVMGPDEFHEKYKNSKEGGLKDNTYTNLMVAWLFRKAFYLFENLDKKSVKELSQKIDLKKDETEKWKDIQKKLNIVISEDGIFAQYDGYFDLKELDWETYKKKYDDIYRMDRILKTERKSCDDYKVAKQADTLMIFYVLEKDEIDEILKNLAYKLPDDYLQKNLNYYLQRTSHGSTLSSVVHAHLANTTGDKKLSWELYKNALTSDFIDVQGGTTGEGIHTGVMSGTILIAMMSFAGLDLKTSKIKLNPNLPEYWRKISFNFNFVDDNYECEISGNEIRMKINSDKKEVEIEIGNITHKIECRKWIEIKY